MSHELPISSLYDLTDDQLLEQGYERVEKAGKRGKGSMVVIQQIGAKVEQVRISPDTEIQNYIQLRRNNRTKRHLAPEKRLVGYLFDAMGITSAMTRSMIKQRLSQFQTTTNIAIALGEAREYYPTIGSLIDEIKSEGSSTISEFWKYLLNEVKKLSDAIDSTYGSSDQQ